MQDHGVAKASKVAAPLQSGFVSPWEMLQLNGAAPRLEMCSDALNNLQQLYILQLWETSGASNLARATSSSEILPVLKSLALRASAALALESVGYKTLRNVEARLHCDRSGVSLLGPSAGDIPSDGEKGYEEEKVKEMADDIDFTPPPEKRAATRSNDVPNVDLSVAEVRYIQAQSCSAQHRPCFHGPWVSHALVTQPDTPFF